MTDQLEADELDGASSDAAGHGEPAVTTPTGRRRRVSKWDRPPDPRDWRFFVGTLGKILIATGILLFGFVAYQLWGTGIETARAQNSLEHQFEALLAASADDDATAAITVPPVTVPPVTSPPVTVPPVTSPPVTGPPATSPPVTSPPTTADDPAADGDGATPDDLADRAVEQELPPIVRGDVLARLEIPRIGKTGGDALYVVPGVGVDDLKKGPGHYPDTPLPGQLGNASIAGHRTTYGEPFFDVDQLAPGDELIVTMANGDRFVYDVTGVEVVAANEYWVVTTRDPGIAELTLTSCHPKYTARDRIVVHSLLNTERSARVGVPTFYDLDDDGDDEPVPGDDPVIDADDTGTEDATDETVATVDDTVVDPVDDPVEDPVEDDETGADPGDAADTGDADDADDADDATGAGPTTGSGDPTTAGQGEAAGDAFARGWFHDRGAFPQIALWGTALIIISLAAYAVSRRFRHDSLGVLVGIAPFVVALYFFFQNVNRLLPPGL